MNIHSLKYFRSAHRTGCKFKGLFAKLGKISMADSDERATYEIYDYIKIRSST